jgi:hypothetical protein
VKCDFKTIHEKEMASNSSNGFEEKGQEVKCDFLKQFMRRRKIPQRTHNSCNEFEQNGHGNYD